MSMGGGHGFSGHVGGFAAHGGGFSGYHGSAGYARGPIYGGGSHWNGGSQGWHGSGGWNGNNWHGNGWNGRGWNGRGWGWRSNGWGWGGYGWWGGYPWWGWGYTGWAGYPWWGWSGDVWYDSYYPSQAYVGSPYVVQGYPASSYADDDDSDGSLASYAPQKEVEQIQSKVNQLRSQRAKSAGPSTPAETHSPAVLVYRDGHTENVENYAIVGSTVWIFNEMRAKKIALSELDLPATKRDNEDRGIDFPVPSSAH